MRNAVLFLSMLLTALGLAVVVASRMTDASQTGQPRLGPELASVRTWGYQLQAVKPALIADGIDLLVIDYTSATMSGSDGFGQTASAIESLRQRSDGRRRIVLCYLSIGEAERYRPYWQRSWDDKPPSWLGPENAAWKGNYTVHYGDPVWQRLILDPLPANATLFERFTRALSSKSKPYLDQIIDAGFDGVYLDRVDAYETELERDPNAKAQMVAFVSAISAYGKARRPGFLIVPQNGEDLAADPHYRRAIDGIAKEDLFFGETGDGMANIAAETRHTISQLSLVKADGKPVFVVEYLAEPELQRTVAGQLKTLGYLSLFAERGLKLPPRGP